MSFPHLSVASNFRKIALICILLAISVVFTACNSQTLILTDKDNGKLVEIKNGSTFKIELSSNPTTGYNWQPLVLDNNIFKLESSNYYPAAKGSMVGAGGTSSFQIKALQKSGDELTFGYLRSWEKIKPIKYYKIFIRII